MENSTQLQHATAPSSTRTYVDLSDLNSASVSASSSASTATSAAETILQSSSPKAATVRQPSNSSTAKTALAAVVNLDSSLARLNKELEILQSAINETGLTDVYHTTRASASAVTANGSAATSPLTLVTLGASPNGTANIESVLAMQCELLEHHKQLRQIEADELEQLKQLGENLCRLERKYDMLENIFKTASSQPPKTTTVVSCRPTAQSMQQQVNVCA